jgi:hypothetical protein
MLHVRSRIVQDNMRIRPTIAKGIETRSSDTRTCLRPCSLLCWEAQMEEGIIYVGIQSFEVCVGRYHPLFLSRGD